MHVQAGEEAVAVRFKLGFPELRSESQHRLGLLARRLVASSPAGDYPFSRPPVTFGIAGDSSVVQRLVGTQNAWLMPDISAAL